jgi:hypothetical protein
MQFGANFVFKSLAKYAFENIIENGQKPSILLKILLKMVKI